MSVDTDPEDEVEKWFGDIIKHHKELAEQEAKNPAKREWVGLTDEERYLGDARSSEEIEYARAIEAKLKEKNHAS